jgi:hypothetical protein
MIDLTPQNIPTELKASQRWVLWQLEDVTDGDKLRKNAKVPKNARTGTNAKHNDPATWSSYEEAIEAHEIQIELKPDPNSVSVHERRGIGYVFGPPFWGKDYDNCVIDGVIDPEVEQDLKRLDTYAEFSQSGTGVHAIGHGEAPKNGHRKDGREIYGYNRFFVFTGNIVPGFDKPIRRFTPSEVKAEFARVAAGKPKFVPVSAKVEELMTRTDFPDLSQAVMSLLTSLMYRHGGNIERVEAEALKSALLTRTHWIDKWPRLRESELKKAKEFYDANPRRTDREENESRRLIVERAHGLVRKAPRYLWPDRLQIGTINHMGGQQSEGKTPLHVDLYAGITAGKDWPDGQPNTWGPRAVLVLSDEDDWESVWLPRFDLAGGDDNRLYRVRNVEITRLSRDGEALSVHNGLTALSRDLHLLREEAAKIEDLIAILIDPISAYLGRKISMNNEQEVRDVLTPLSIFAGERGLVVNTIGHLNKSESQDPLMRMMGAAAFTGVARVVYSVGPDQKATGNDAKYHHVMARVRGVVSDRSLRYHTELVEREIEAGVKSKVIRVVWDGETDQTAQDNVTPVSRTQQREVEKAAIMLRDFLKGGKRRIQECTAFLKSNGYDMEKLKADRVKDIAKVGHKKEGKEWFWFLETGQVEATFELSAARKADDAPSY